MDILDITVADAINIEYREDGTLELAYKVLELANRSYDLRVMFLDMDIHTFMELYC